MHTAGVLPGPTPDPIGVLQKHAKTLLHQRDVLLHIHKYTEPMQRLETAIDLWGQPDAAARLSNMQFEQIPFQIGEAKATQVAYANRTHDLAVAAQQKALQSPAPGPEESKALGFQHPVSWTCEEKNRQNSQRMGRQDPQVQKEIMKRLAHQTQELRQNTKPPAVETQILPLPMCLHATPQMTTVTEGPSHPRVERPSQLQQVDLSRLPGVAQGDAAIALGFQHPSLPMENKNDQNSQEEVMNQPANQPQELGQNVKQPAEETQILHPPMCLQAMPQETPVTAGPSQPSGPKPQQQAPGFSPVTEAHRVQAIGTQQQAAARPTSKQAQPKKVRPSSKPFSAHPHTAFSTDTSADHAAVERSRQVQQIAQDQPQPFPETHQAEEIPSKQTPVRQEAVPTRGFQAQDTCQHNLQRERTHMIRHASLAHHEQDEQALLQAMVNTCMQVELQQQLASTTPAFQTGAVPGFGTNKRKAVDDIPAQPRLSKAATHSSSTNDTRDMFKSQNLAVSKESPASRAQETREASAGDSFLGMDGKDKPVIQIHHTHEAVESNLAASADKHTNLATLLHHDHQPGHPEHVASVEASKSVEDRSIEKHQQPFTCPSVPNAPQVPPEGQSTQLEPELAEVFILTDGSVPMSVKVLFGHTAGQFASAYTKLQGIDVTCMSVRSAMGTPVPCQLLLRQE